MVRLIPHKTWMRWAVGSVLAIVVLILAVFAYGGVFASGLLRDDGLLPNHDEEPLDLEVVAIRGGEITLRITDESDEDGDWQQNGLYGLVSVDGYDQVGDIVSLSATEVVREYVPLDGGVDAGDFVRVDSYAFPDDPMEAHGIAFEEVTYTSPLAEFPAWFVTGSSDTWVVFVHGRNAKRGESLRALPVAVDLGHPALSITYRNDRNVPADPSGFHRYGQTEWRDLEAAVQYAVDRGAEDVVVMGYSMGGAIVTSFLYESQLVDDRVAGAVLDAPMLDFGATVDLGASERGFPQIVATMAKLFSGFRFGVDWGAMDYVSRSDELDVPILLFHGDDDSTVPVETSDALKAARPNLVEYYKSAGTEHVRSWNADRDAYEATLHEFLERVAE